MSASSPIFVCNRCNKVYDHKDILEKHESRCWVQQAEKSLSSRKTRFPPLPSNPLPLQTDELSTLHIEERNDDTNAIPIYSTTDADDSVIECLDEEDLEDLELEDETIEDIHDETCSGNGSERTQSFFPSELLFRIFCEMPLVPRITVSYSNKNIRVCYKCSSVGCQFIASGKVRDDDSWLGIFAPHSCQFTEEAKTNDNRCRFTTRTLDLIIQPLLNKDLAQKTSTLIEAVKNLYPAIAANVPTRTWSRRMVAAREKFMPLTHIRDICEMHQALADFNVETMVTEANVSLYICTSAIFPWAKELWSQGFTPSVISLDFTHSIHGTYATATTKLCGSFLLALGVFHFPGNETLQNWQKVIDCIVHHFPGCKVFKTDGFHGINKIIKDAIHMRCIIHLSESLQKLLKGASVKSEVSFASKQPTWDTFRPAFRAIYLKNPKIAQYLCPALALSMSSTSTANSSANDNHNNHNNDDDNEGGDDIDNGDNDDDNEGDDDDNNGGDDDQYEIDNEHMTRINSPDSAQLTQWKELNEQESLETCPVIWSTIQILSKNVSVQGDCTSNSCESFHSLIRHAKRIPFPLSLFEICKISLAQLLKIRTKISKIPTLLTAAYQQRLVKSQSNAPNYAFVPGSLIRNAFSIVSFRVSKTPLVLTSHRTIDILNRSCSCSYWQTWHLPCPHVIVGVSLNLLTLKDTIAKYMNVPLLSEFLDPYPIPYLPTPLDILTAISEHEGSALSLPPIVEKSGRPKQSRYKSSLELRKKRTTSATSSSTSEVSSKKPRKTRFDKGKSRKVVSDPHI